MDDRAEILQRTEVCPDTASRILVAGGRPRGPARETENVVFVERQ